MAVPSTFADLSTTPASNGGLISGSTVPSDLDNHFRSVYALIASIYANSGNGWASPFLTAANPSYTGTLTGGTGVVNLGSGQLYKDGSGNVVIGGTTADRKLHVAGTAVLKSATNPYLYLHDTAGATGHYSMGTGGTFYATGTFGIRDEISGVIALTIDSNGNFFQRVPATAPSLTRNNTVVLNLTSDTNLRISARGSDGVTRTADITLA